MARAATKIKEKTTKDGKQKFQAQVWHNGVFYGSKTFDSKGMAAAYKEAQLLKVIKGELQPASVRRAKRRSDAALDQPMTHWAALYIEQVKHGDSRAAEYKLVGKLLANKTLKDFHGRAGAQLFEQLAHDWKFNRQPRSLQPRPADAPPLEPLKDQTVRLRLSALWRLIKFGKSKLPDSASFQMPAMDELFEFKLPAAHSSPRKRLPSDDETVRLYRHFDPQSDFGQWLRVIDETGCRLSEVRLAQGAHLRFFEEAGQVVGGELTLYKHKTSKKVGERKVPLSLFAAQILHSRVSQFGDGPLFASLGTNHQVCEIFDEACQELEIDGLLIKDFRRGFINRNKKSVPYVDMVNIVGQSTMLDSKNLSQGERATMAAVGHKHIGTSVGYSTPESQELAGVFTLTSRWPRLAALLRPAADEPAESGRPDLNVEAMQRELVEMLNRLRHAGVTAAAT